MSVGILAMMNWRECFPSIGSIEGTRHDQWLTRNDVRRLGPAVRSYLQQLDFRRCSVTREWDTNYAGGQHPAKN